MDSLHPSLRTGFLLIFLACLAIALPAVSQNRPMPGAGGSPSTGSGKILDDSTKQIYGPQTTRYLREADLLNNRDTTYAVDTVLDNLHAYNAVNRSGNRYVDLGSLGTALRPVFYTPPAQIGTFFGVNAFSPFAFTPETVRYYDTRSPYTQVRYVQGGLYQQQLQAGHSRNINPRWNLGFDYQRITSPKQFSYRPPQRREERNVDHHAVVAYTRWLSKDSAYHLLAHFSHQNHVQNDIGGLLDTLAVNARPDELLLDFQEAGQSQLAPSLGGTQQVRTTDFRNHWHLYHQYRIGGGLQVYHVFDRQAHRYSYLDENPLYEPFRAVRGRYFYPDVLPGDARHFYYSDTATRDQMRYVAYENRLGLKGTYRGWDYRLSARRRDFSATYSGQYSRNLGIPYRDFTNTPYDPVRVRRAETYLGVWGQYRFSRRIRLYAEGEYLLFRDYRLSGIFESPWFRAGYVSMLHSPTLVQQRMSGNHFRWDEGLRAVSVNELFGQMTLRYRVLHFEPSLTLTNLANYVYFDQQARPAQSSPFQIVSAGATLALHGRVLHAVHQVVFTQTTNNLDVIRIPQWFANGRWYAEGFLFRKALYMQIGVEAHYKSAYFADAYMPATGQFHLQDELRVPGYPVIDAFANARVGRVQLFAKMSHVNQGFVFGNGYFTTAYYPGQRRTFGFGVLWPLFD